MVTFAVKVRRLLAVAGGAGLVLAGSGVALAGPVDGPSDNTPARCPVSITDCPTADPFFTPPANLASLRDGAVVGSRPVTLATSEVADAASALTVTYRSEDSFGAPVMDVTTVIRPTAPYRGTGPQPLVSLQFAEDSLGRQCAPSYSLATGHDGTNGVIQSESTLLETLLAAGDLVAAPDYEGPAEQFTAGIQEGHAVLDGLRAAAAISPGVTAATPLGLIGYSGGGLATGWATELMPSYAPTLNIKGAAEGGVPNDLSEGAKSIDGTALFGLVPVAVGGLDRAYPQAGIYAAFNDAGKQLLRDVATDCAQTALEDYPLKKLDDYTTVPDLIDQPAFVTLLHAIHLEQHVPTVPLYDYHGYSDEIVPYSSDVDFVNFYCSHGASVTHVVLPGEHIAAEDAGAPAAAAWLAGRLAGDPDTSTCGTPPIPALPGSPTSDFVPPGDTATPALPEAPHAALLLLAAGGVVAAGAILRRRRA